MPTIVSTFSAIITRKTWHWRFLLRHRWARWRRAWLYARDRLSADDAQQVFVDCEIPAGWFPLLLLAVDDALDNALAAYEDHPDLRRLLADGCAHVHRKWDDPGDNLHIASEWAIECALDYARDEGITLVLRTADDESVLEE
jgi:hypothetical protein